MASQTNIITTTATISSLISKTIPIRTLLLSYPFSSSSSSRSLLCATFCNPNGFAVHPTTKPNRRHLVFACASPPPPDVSTTSVSTKLYISGLSFRTTEESLTNAFKNFGQLVEVNLVMDKIAKRPRGFAFLRYRTEDESKKAIEGMHGKFLDGRVIFVEVAKPRWEFRNEIKEGLRRGTGT